MFLAIHVPGLERLGVPGFREAEEDLVGSGAAAGSDPALSIKRRSQQISVNMVGCHHWLNGQEFEQSRRKW